MTKSEENRLQRPKILGISASLRSGRWGQGADELIKQICSLSNENALNRFLRTQSKVCLTNALNFGRKENISYDKQYRNLRKFGGKSGLCNSEVFLTSALWSAYDSGCDIDFISLSEFFPAFAPPRDVDYLKKKLLQADGIIMATPVYFGDRSSLAHALIRVIHNDNDFRRALNGKLASGIAVGAKRNGGQETTLIYFMLDMVNLGFLAVGNDSETTAQYGGTCHAGDIGTAAKDDYGIRTSMGTGRRIARVAKILNLSKNKKITEKLKVGFWITQDREGFALKEVKKIANKFKSKIEPVIIDVSSADFCRCLACNVCPVDIGPDNEYRCIVTSKKDFMKKVHSQIIDVDAIVPVALVPKDFIGLESKYQRFNERTRYLRRGDYVFSDYAFSPLVFEEVGSGDSHKMRVLTSMIRHHTVMTRPMVGCLHKGKILNQKQILDEFDQFINQSKRLLIGRAISSSSADGDDVKYNPVGYRISQKKEKSDEKLKKRDGSKDFRIKKYKMIKKSIKNAV